MKSLFEDVLIVLCITIAFSILKLSPAAGALIGGALCLLVHKIRRVSE